MNFIRLLLMLALTVMSLVAIVTQTYFMKLCFNEYGFDSV